MSMSSIVETAALASRMRADGWADVTERITAHDWHGQPHWQVDATHPQTGERVHVPNLAVYHEHYAAPSARAYRMDDGSFDQLRDYIRHTAPLGVDVLDEADRVVTFLQTLDVDDAEYWLARGWGRCIEAANAAASARD